MLIVLGSSWLAMLFRFHSKEKERERACAHAREKKNILLYKGCSLSVCSAKGKRSSPFSITKGFLVLVFPHVSPLKPPVPSAVWEIQSPFLSQITAHARGDPAAKATLLTFDHDVSAA